ncbi:hypothetical protein HYW59_02625 [Candidatus Kaiserbacteria bacterium]|nr:hypothetical protein [Candidatus Kaiserbacteria bacterium]
MFRPLGKQRGRIIAVADVGNGSVAVGIVEVSSHGHARILVSERASLPSGERGESAAATGIVSLLGETAQKVLKKYGSHVNSAYAVIHSPWTRSKTIRAESKLERETKIEKGMLDTLARQALEADTQFDHGKILEAGIIRVELNGYPTLKPIGKHAQHIAASALLSECEPKVREGVAGTLSKVFACPPPTLRSDTRALLSVTRESASLPKESLIVNMTYEATNTIVVRKGIITETALIPEGSSSIVRRIGSDKMPEETMTLIRLLALDQCEAEACEATKTAIAKAEPEIVKIFGEMFGRLSAARRLPNRLLLLAHEDLSPWLVQFFSRIDFAQFTVTTRPFSPEPLSMNTLKDLVAFEKDVAPDIPLGIAAALVNMEEHAG